MTRVKFPRSYQGPVEKERERERDREGQRERQIEREREEKNREGRGEEEEKNPVSGIVDRLSVVYGSNRVRETKGSSIFERKESL